MKSLTKNHSGLTHVALFGVLVIVAVVGFAGYRVLQNQKGTSSSNSQTTISTKKSTAVPATVSNVSDLNQASTAASSLPLDSDLNPSQMDSDVNSLL